MNLMDASAPSFFRYCNGIRPIAQCRAFLRSAELVKQEAEHDSISSVDKGLQVMNYHLDIQTVIYFHLITRAVPAFLAGYSDDSNMARGARQGVMTGAGEGDFHG
jgi:hypothetical protein